MATLKTKIQVRRDTAANLANVVLAAGEPGYATDTKKYAVGDGSTKFSSLTTQISGSDSVDGFHITNYGYKYQSSASISLKRDQLADNTDYIYVKMTTTNNYHSQHVRFKVVPGYDNISGSTEVVAYCRAQNEFYLDSVLYNGNKFIGIYQPSANTNIYYLKFDKFNGTYASNTNSGSIVVYAQVPGITLSLIEKGHSDYATVSAYSYVSVPSKGIYASHLWNNMYPTANNTNDLGSSNYKWKNIHGVTIYENGTSLAAKYLGISAKAADSDKLDGKDASEFATSGHIHTTTIATSTGTNELTLSHGGKYSITAGGDSFIFTMPSDSNTDTKVTQSSTTTDSWRKVVLGKQSGTIGTAVESQTDQVYVTPNIEVQPSTGTLAVKKLLITDTTMINHIEFKRNGWNYIVASGGTSAAFGFVAGGKSASGANSTLAIYGDKFIPGQRDNQVDMGDSSYHFKDFYIKGKIYNGSYNYTLPSKTGTIALTSDIPSVTDFVKGPSSATDNAVARFNATTGKLIQNSGVTIDDSNNISTAGSLKLTNNGDVMWNSGSWWQRIKITDDSDANTNVFEFQQSSNSGSSWTSLFTVLDNGSVKAKKFVTDGSSNEYVILGDGSTKALSDFTMDTDMTAYMPKSGGQFIGPISFKDGTALPSKTLQYIIGIDAFDDGGQAGWQSKANFLSGYVTGSGLTSDTIILGGGSSAVKTSSKKISTSVGTDDTTVPTSKAVKDYVTGLGYITSDTKVTNTLNATTKYYVTGTTSATTNTGTQIFDTAVYVNTTAGALHATTYNMDTNATMKYDSATQCIRFVIN